MMLARTIPATSANVYTNKKLPPLPTVPFLQIAFEFKSDVRLDYDVVVDAKLYFNYMRADEAFYTLRSKDAPLCLMDETCHRRSDACPANSLLGPLRKTSTETALVRTCV